MFILYVFLAFIAIGLVVAVVVGCGIIQKLQEASNNVKLVSDKLADTKQNDKTGTVLLPVVKLDSKTECNTVLPLPIGAEMCNHNFDIITNQVIRAPHEEKCVVILQCTKCGAMDKTIATTSAPPPPPPPPPAPPVPKSECRHNWIKEKTVTLESAFEQMEALLTNKKNNKSYQNTKANAEDTPFDPATAPPWMFRKKICMQRLCTKCGEIDRVVTSNFDLENEEDNGERVDDTKEK